MASHWTHEALISAVDDVRNHKLSCRKAVAQYEIPESSLTLYVTQAEIGSDLHRFSQVLRRPSLLITSFTWAVLGMVRLRNSSLISYKWFLRKMVMKIPSWRRKWWKLFKGRHPELSLRSPELLQIARAKCSTPEIIQAQFIEFEQFLMINGVKNRPFYGLHVIKLMWAMVPCWLY